MAVTGADDAFDDPPGDAPSEPADQPGEPADDGDGLPGPTTAYAINWKTVLAVDAAMGALVALAGVISMVVWSFPLGVFLTGLGLFYVAMVARRARGWQHLRRQAGL